MLILFHEWRQNPRHVCGACAHWMTHARHPSESLRGPVKPAYQLDPARSVCVQPRTRHAQTVVRVVDHDASGQSQREPVPLPALVSADDVECLGSRVAGATRGSLA